MIDQATELRNLVMRTAKKRSQPTGPPPKQILFLGGQPQVGITTCTTHHALSFCDQGLRVALVDANLHAPRIAEQCGLKTAEIPQLYSTPMSDIHEWLQRGPAGMQILPHVSDGVPGVNPQAIKQLMYELAHLGRHADLVCTDLGGLRSPVRGRFWQSADFAVLVTQDDDQCVMDTYAAVKQLHQASTSSPSLLLLVNQTTSTVAQQVHERFARCCQKFLGVNVELLGHIPRHDYFAPSEGVASWMQDDGPLEVQGPLEQLHLQWKHLLAAVERRAA